MVVLYSIAILSQSHYCIHVPHIDINHPKDIAPQLNQDDSWFCLSNRTSNTHFIQSRFTEKGYTKVIGSVFNSSNNNDDINYMSCNAKGTILSENIWGGLEPDTLRSLYIDPSENNYTVGYTYEGL